MMDRGDSDACRFVERLSVYVKTSGITSLFLARRTDVPVKPD
jgi:hypothetical protein